MNYTYNFTITANRIFPTIEDLYLVIVRDYYTEEQSIYSALWTNHEHRFIFRPSDFPDGEKQPVLKRNVQGESSHYVVLAWSRITTTYKKYPKYFPSSQKKIMNVKAPEIPSLLIQNLLEILDCKSLTEFNQKYGIGISTLSNWCTHIKGGQRITLTLITILYEMINKKNKKEIVNKLNHVLNQLP